MKKQRFSIVIALFVTVGLGILIWSYLEVLAGANRAISSNVAAIRNAQRLAAQSFSQPDPLVCAPAVAAAGISQHRTGLVDRFAGIDPVLSREERLGATGTVRRERLLRTSRNYPLIRVEETLELDPSTGDRTLLEQRAMVGDHVMVRLRDGYHRSDLDSTLSRYGFTLRKAMRAPGFFLVSVAPATLDSISLLVESLSAEACLDVPEPDYLVSLADITPNDTSYSQLWGMPNIKVPKVWEMTTGTGGVVVAVFDSGVQLDHPDLVDNIWVNPSEIAGNGIDDDGNFYINDLNGWDFYANDDDPTDGLGHGTHVAGTIGAVGNNGIGVAGVCWNTKIMSIKIFGPNGEAAELSNIIAGVYYVITQKLHGIPVRVANHSWGGSAYSQYLRDALGIAGEQGILHVAAAGNYDSRYDFIDNRNNDIYPHYPSSYTLSNMIAVASTTQADDLNSFSHYGVTSVDLGAPGSGIYSCLLGGGYTYKSGTSMATPHVAGVAALMMDYMPHLTWEQVRRALVDGVDSASALSGKSVTGGRLNAYGAFESLPLYLEHVPLGNTTDVASDHIIEAHIRPSVPILDANRVVVLWNTTGSTALFSTNIMQHVSNDLFRATIPAQSQGSAIYYMIRAETKTNRRASSPENAPSALHHFDVTYPVQLWVVGYPGNFGMVSPDYGSQTAPWGGTVHASASQYEDETASRRLRCDGWYGAGSAPAFGSSNQVNFIMRQFSYLQWMWQEQFALVQSSTPIATLGTQSWWDTGADVETVVAPAWFEVAGTNYAFVNWLIDGNRYPGVTQTARNPATGLTMNAARDAVAVYLPEMQDDDSDSLPDWWELFYFGSLDTSGTNDFDGDGFSQSSELADQSDPRDPTSIPTGPSILHTPLADPMPRLSPWRVTAAVTDRVAVASVRLSWQRNGGGWDTAPMTTNGVDLYSAEIPAPHALADEVYYRIESMDTGGNSSTTEVFRFTVAYPLATLSPQVISVKLNPKSSTTETVMLGNIGNADLVWQVLTNWSDSVSGDEGQWSHEGFYDLWHITAQNAHSGGYAWYCGQESTQEYVDLQDDSLITPAVSLGLNPQFSFWQWAEMEADGWPGYETHYWDGGVVDISTNGGASFERIVPVGGYPNKITPNPDSPFPDNMPCIGGTGGWERISFDLSDYAGQAVNIRFRFGSDRYSVDRGWYIDDVEFSWESSWLQFSEYSGRVAPASSEGVPVLLDATRLPVGVYSGVLSMDHNDPTRSTLTVLVQLTVVDAPSGTSISLAEAAPRTFVIAWPSTTGQLYSLMLNTSLTDTVGWSGVPGYTNLSGVQGTMSYTGTIDSLPSQFYRIDETQQ